MTVIRANPYDPIVIAMIGGQIVLIITTIGGVIMAIITHVRMTSVQVQQAANTATIDSVARATAAIDGHVNSEKTAAEERAKAKDIEIAILREQVAHERTNAGLLAQAVAVRQRVEPSPTAPAASAALATPETPIPVSVVNLPLAVAVAPTEEKSEGR